MGKYKTNAKLSQAYLHKKCTFHLLPQTCKLICYKGKYYELFKMNFSNLIQNAELRGTQPCLAPVYINQLRKNFPLGKTYHVSEILSLDVCLYIFYPLCQPHQPLQKVSEH